MFEWVSITDTDSSMEMEISKEEPKVKHQIKELRCAREFPCGYQANQFQPSLSWQKYALLKLTYFDQRRKSYGSES